MAESEEVKRLKRSVTAYKAHFTQAERKLEKLVETATEAAALNFHTYKETLKLIDNAKAKFSLLETALEKLATTADWPEASPKWAEHTATCQEQADRYSALIVKGTNFLGTFPKQVVSLFAPAPPSAAPAGGASSAGGASDRDKSFPKSNAALLPETLRNDADPVTFDAWVELFACWYSSSNFDKASLKEQQMYLMSVLDSTLQSILRESITARTPIFGTAGVNGCIEVIKREFEHLNPIFARRAAFLDKK